MTVRTLQSDFAAKLGKLLCRATELNTPVFILELYRSIETQKVYVARGVSKTMNSKNVRVDIESVGSGAGGGLLMAILTWLGIKQRLDRQDRDIEKLQDSAVWRSTCVVTHKNVDERLARMETKMDDIHRVLIDRWDK